MDLKGFVQGGRGTVDFSCSVLLRLKGVWGKECDLGLGHLDIEVPLKSENADGEVNYSKVVCV